MSNAEKKNILDIARKKYKLRLQRDELLKSKLPKDKKQQELAQIDAQISKLNTNKNRILSSYYFQESLDKITIQTDAIGRATSKTAKTTSMTQEEIQEYFLEEQARLRAEIEAETAKPQNEATRRNIEAYKAELDGLNMADLQHGFIVPQEDGGFELVLNKDNALIGTAAHELMHAVLFKTLQQDKALQDSMGDALISHLQSLDVQGGDLLGRKLSPYGKWTMDKDGKPQFERADNFGEETITVISEMVNDGSLEYDEGFFTKIGNFFRRMLQDKFGRKVEFNTGRDVFNFIKDFNYNIKKNKVSKALVTVAKEGAKGKLVDPKAIEKAKVKAVKAEKKATKAKKIADVKAKRKKEKAKIQFSKEASDKVQRIYEEKGVAGAMDIIDQFKPITNRIAEKRREAPNYDKELLMSEIEIGERGILDLIREYKPESGVPLAAYINKFLPARAIEASKRVLGKEFTEDALKPMITIALNQLSRRSWDGWSRDAVDKWLRVMPEEGQPLLTALVKEGWIEKFRATKTPYDTWDVACALFDRLYPDGVPEDRPTPDIKAESDMIIEEDVGSSASKEEGDSETEDQTQQGYVVNWQDAVVSDHPEGNAGGAMGITWEGKEHKQQVKIRPDHLNTVYDLTVDNMKEIIDEAAPWTGKGKGVKWFMMKDNAGRALANRIRRYVQSQTRSKFKSDQKHGRLDKRSLVRVALPPIDKGEWNKKIFYTRNNKRALNTAIHILVDWSGSMQGDKQIYAAMATQRAAEVFSRSLRIPTMISSFTNGATESDIAIIKHFDKPATEKQIAARFGQWYRLMSANADADAVMWAYNRLRKRKEPRKLLIVLSDGAPANCYGHGSSHDSLMAAVNRIEQEGKVEVFGLGIKSDAVSEYYRNHQVITEPEDINEALLNVLKEGMKYA